MVDMQLCEGILVQEGYQSGRFPFRLELEAVSRLAQVDPVLADRYVTLVVGAYRAFIQGDDLPSRQLASELAAPNVPGVKGQWMVPSPPRSPSPPSRVDEVRALSSWRTDSVLSGDTLAERDGYCYLWLVRPERRVVVSSRLGRWPLLEDVMALDSSDADFESPKRLQLVRRGDVVHVQPVSTDLNGQNLADVLTGIALQLEGSTSRAILPGSLGGHYSASSACSVEVPCMDQVLVGGSEMELIGERSSVSEGDAIRISQAKRDLASLVSERQGHDLGFVWVSESDTEGFVAKKHYTRSAVVDLSGFCSDSLVSRSLALSVPNRAIVQLPVGWRLRSQDVLVGSVHTTTFFGFRKSCEIQLVPPEGGQGFPGALLLTGNRVNWALDVMLSPKSTDARFVRAVGLPVVLRVPEALRQPCVGPQLEEVMITDPLETWNSMEEVRIQSHQYGQVCDTGGFGLIALKNFRANGSATFSVGGFVELESHQAGVVVPFGAGLHVSDVQSSNEDFQWSVRRVVCVDSYCMDSGGPSDSEFSDAI